MKKPLSFFEFSRPLLHLAIVPVLLIIFTSMLDLLPPLFIKLAIDDGINNRDADMIMLCALAFVGIAIAKCAVLVSKDYFTIRFANTVVAYLRGATVERLLRLPMAYFGKQASGALTSILIDGTIPIIEGLFIGLVHAVAATCLTVFCLALLFQYAGPGVVFAIAGVIATYVYVTRRMMQRLETAADRRRLAQAAISGLVGETLRHIDHIQSMDISANFENVLKERLVAYARCDYHARALEFLQKHLLSQIGLIGIALLLTLSNSKAQRGEISLGAVFTVMYIGELLFFIAVQQFFELAARIQPAMAGFRMISRIWEEHSEIDEKLEALEGPINDVTFSDAAIGIGSAVLLGNVNLALHRGETYAVIGPSGSGKTTLAKALLRQSDLVDGTLTINKRSIHEVRTEDLFRETIYIPQETALFDASFFENVTLGREPDAIRFSQSLDQAALKEVIAALPQGLATPLGELREAASGGEIRRLGLARGFVRPGSIAIFDEPYAGLDAAIRHQVQRNILALRHDHLVVVITHDLFNLDHYDHVIVVGSGRITCFPRERVQRLLQELEGETGPDAVSGPAEMMVYERFINAAHTHEA